jgi:DHA2 family multidrug resistance protein
MTELITPYTTVPLQPDYPAAWNLDTVTGLLRVSNEIQRQAMMIGYINAFYLFALTAALSVPLAWLMRGARREA